MGTELTKAGEKGLAGLLQKMQPEMARALPAHLSPDRMARVAMTAVRTTRNLEECTPRSFAGCIMDASQLGLEVNTPLGLAYLIPRKIKGVYHCTLLIGYQGMIDLARRSGLVSDIYAHVVREGDSFEYELGLERKLRHVPTDDGTGSVTHVYAVVKLKDGESQFRVLTRAEIEKRRDRGGYRPDRESPWNTDPEAMALKTAIRALWPWMPKSSEMALAASLDDAASGYRAPTFSAATMAALDRNGIKDVDAAPSVLASLESEIHGDAPEEAEEAGCGADDEATP